MTQSEYCALRAILRMYDWSEYDDKLLEKVCWTKAFRPDDSPPFAIKIVIDQQAEMGEWLQDLTQRIQPEYHWAIAPIIERFGNPAPSDTINQPQETP